jgi:DNA invertase Pin-like site-specific DNA recombinase
MATIGYARVSTDEQSTQLQESALRGAGAERIYADTATGKTMDRPALRQALAILQPGDVLMVWRLDRLGRSLPDLIHQVNTLNERGVQFQSLTEAFDTTTPGGELIFHVFGAVAQFERALIVGRTQAGLAAAKASGKPVGRPRLVTPERADLARQMRRRGMTLTNIADELRVSRATVVRLLDLAVPVAG